MGGCIHLFGCSQVTIDGPILRDPHIWCLATFACSDVHIAYVKQIGLWRYNADGIDICNCQDVTVRHCFVRTFDDSLAVKGMRYCSDMPIPEHPVRGLRRVERLGPGVGAWAPRRPHPSSPT